MGTGFDYVCLPSDGASGGIVAAWARDAWSVTGRVSRQFSVTISLQPSDSPGLMWLLATVYGPVLDAMKPAFLSELRVIAADCPAPLLVCGDFNLIYQGTDRSNSWLNLASMRRFRRTLDAMAVEEI